MEGLSSWEGPEKLIWLAMDDKLLGGLMNSLAACAVDETVRISLPLTSTSLMNIDNGQVCFVKTSASCCQHINAMKREVFRQLTTGFVTVFSSDLSGRPSLELFSCWSNSWVCSQTWALATGIMNWQAKQGWIYCTYFDFLAGWGWSYSSQYEILGWKNFAESRNKTEMIDHTSECGFVVDFFSGLLTHRRPKDS